MDEVEALKRDKTVLMLELVRLRQQQQVHPHHIISISSFLLAPHDDLWTCMTSCSFNLPRLGRFCAPACSCSQICLPELSFSPVYGPFMVL